jgi:peptidoglycan-associated lipoprotein
MVDGAVKVTGSLLAACAVLLAGCAAQRPPGDVAPVETIDPLKRPEAAQASATPETGVASVEVPAPPPPALPPDAPKVVYFDFDSYTVKDVHRPALEAHARWLSSDATKRLVINGHTDDRGGREYNLALGQKRADTVAKFLTGLGVAHSQMECVSYGEERPAAKGRGEDAWAKNRRAELEYR